MNEKDNFQLRRTSSEILEVNSVDSRSCMGRDEEDTVIQVEDEGKRRQDVLPGELLVHSPGEELKGGFY